jgi:hypothetical protein
LRIAHQETQRRGIPVGALPRHQEGRYWDEIRLQGDYLFWYIRDTNGREVLPEYAAVDPSCGLGRLDLCDRVLKRAVLQ